MYSLYGGIEQLSIKLKEELQKLPNVQVCLDSPATRLEFGEKVKVHVKVQSKPSVLEVDHVVCAIPSKALQKLIEQPIEELTFNPSVDVAVVNFAFDKKVLPYAAFGYLVPRSVSDSIALGVVFDSCSFPLATPNHEILTVMMGGHQFPSRIGDSATITNDELLFKARQVLGQQLKIQDVPVAHQVTLQHQCIPQYLVNHPRRMQKLHRTIENQFKSKLSVTGASYTGVAINDCILYSGKLADQLLSKGILGSDPYPSPVTGLELYETLS
ncbi:oxygen-dependent protoporphyrinogen oxidase [Entomophthora muscae]|uniref:Oxygen-dependent protoporphyrinogen oxidase n=1 Tax=Entomophthora muscae TaxID=34485 RepID=A0ACC2RLF4_9FUNG|nr:oxygen-dependent protoporphyrinogen oxidase [Entomophthora muscae]